MIPVADSPAIDTAFTRQLGIRVPIIGGAMYPCSNPELVAAVSAAGGIGIVQPISLTYVHGYDFRAGLRKICSLTDKPIGMNALIEASSKRYHRQMEQWLDIALEEGVRFFVTSLGKPGWVVQRVHDCGGLVYHDATEYKWAAKGVAEGVDGLIAVNQRAGGHAGTLSATDLYQQLVGFKLPLICAGGIGDEQDFVAALKLGYSGVQMGTRFIASQECSASADYKAAILAANEADIVLSERITGVPVSVINTAYIRRQGLTVNAVERWLLRQAKLKHVLRLWYTLNSLVKLKRGLQGRAGRRDFWQAGKSVKGIHSVTDVATIIQRFSRAWQHAQSSV